jgi:hypothetical protein
LCIRGKNPRKFWGHFEKTVYWLSVLQSVKTCPQKKFLCIIGRNQKQFGGILKNSFLVECFTECKDLPQEIILVLYYGKKPEKIGGHFEKQFTS